MASSQRSNESSSKLIHMNHGMARWISLNCGTDAHSASVRRAGGRPKPFFMWSQSISEELEKERLTEPLARQIEQKKKQIDGYKADLQRLVLKGSDAQLKRHQELQAAAQVLLKKIEDYKERRRAFEGLRDEVARHAGHYRT